MSFSSKMDLKRKKDSTERKKKALVTENSRKRKHFTGEENEQKRKIRGLENEPSKVFSPVQENFEIEKKRRKHHEKHHRKHHRKKENLSVSSKSNTYAGDVSDISGDNGPLHASVREESLVGTDTLTRKTIKSSKFDEKKRKSRTLPKYIGERRTTKDQKDVLGAIKLQAGSRKESKVMHTTRRGSGVSDTSDYKFVPRKSSGRKKSMAKEMQGTTKRDSLAFRIYSMMYDFKKQLEETPFEILPLPQALTREQIKLFFRRGFRPDQINIDEKVSFVPSFDYSAPDDEQDVIFLADDQEPIDFLIRLGFDADEAALALQQSHVQQRVQAALVEARIWVSYVTDKQGSLIFFLSQVVNEKAIRFFLPTVEAIVNNRITSASEIDAFMRILENLEETKAYLIKDSIDLQRLHTVGPARDKKEIISRFMDLYGTANEASEVSRGRHIDERETLMLEYLVLRYRPSLKNHVDLIATYIGHGLLRTKMQLDAAILFIARHEDSEIDIMELESFCGIDGKIKEVDGEICWDSAAWSDETSSSGTSSSVSESGGEQDSSTSENLFVERKDESRTIVGTIIDSIIDDIPSQKYDSSIYLKELFLRDREGQASGASRGISDQRSTIRSEGSFQYKPDVFDDQEPRTTESSFSDPENAEQRIAGKSSIRERISPIEQGSYESDASSSGSVSSSATSGEDSTKESSESVDHITDLPRDSTGFHRSSPESATTPEENVSPYYASGEPSFSSPDISDDIQTTEGVDEKRSCANKLRDFASRLFGGFGGRNGSAEKRRWPPFLRRRAEEERSDSYVRVKEATSQTEETGFNLETTKGTSLQNEGEVPSNDIGWLLEASPNSRYTIFWNVHSERNHSFAGDRNVVTKSKPTSDELLNLDSRTKNSKSRSKCFTRFHENKVKECDSKSHGDYVEDI